MEIWDVYGKYGLVLFKLYDKVKVEGFNLEIWKLIIVKR